ncbi:FxsA family protein [Parageobacillus thermoglucosidasius]|uniref:FxsA cytoplasmic membrane protein n=1 Tax=Geobacillus sp. (strain Y4.1MC1) TaxID=581103 RepID=A0A7U4DJW3_GEOS0|nr:FxsA family protein [Parageobacillus thermoglucosidasius]AEH46897.1 FxsA cytoplasmic membrane protein [Parageobacillus thermoglucosidasius C56-YS93]
MKWLIGMLIAMPALEIVLFILFGKLIGIWPTVAFIMLTGMMGVWLAKRQGLAVVEEAKREIFYGRLPSGAMLDGICVFIGGVLLLMPGFLTDAVGVFLLLPATRSFVKPYVARWLKSFFETKTFFFYR